MYQVTTNNLVTVVIAILATVPPTITALAAYNKATETHELVNSRMTEMLKVVQAAATAEGILKEKREERARESAIAVDRMKDIPKSVVQQK